MARSNRKKPRAHPRQSSQSSIDLDSPDRPFDNIINFRDVGRTVNQFCGVKILKEGLVFRSARLDDASERDKRRLSEELRIATVIDLRSRTEHQMATRKRRAENLSSHAGAGTAENQNDPNQNDAQSPLPVDPDEHLLPLPGSSRALVSLTGSRFERTLLWRLDWYNYLKAITLATTGYRTDAIRLIGSQVMQPRGLTGLAQDTLDASGSELRCVFELLANESSYPVLLHCTQGKDRTGLIVLLALLLCGENVVPASAIADDYARSELELIPEFEERMREIRELGLDENYTRCPPGFILSTTDYLTEKYGGVSKYLAGIGVDECMQQCIRSRILA